MNYMLVGGLAPWGQAAAIVLALYLFVSILLSLVLAGVLMFGFAWVREKAELVKKLRPVLNRFNEVLAASQHGDPLPPEIASNKIVSAVVQVPRMTAGLSDRAGTIEEKVEQSSERVAQAVIEFHARAEMVKGMARAFFLPGLKKSRASVSSERMAHLEDEQAVVRERHAEEQPLEQEIVIIQSTR